MSNEPKDNDLLPADTPTPLFDALSAHPKEVEAAIAKLMREDRHARNAEAIRRRVAAIMTR